MNDLIRAAGAVVWRPGPQILVIHRPRYNDWSLPKGKLEPGEHPLLAAVREVREETTVQPVLGPRLPVVRYRVGGEPKRVTYWMASAAEAKPDNEVDAVEWLAVPRAIERLSYPHDRDLVAGLAPVPTVPLIIVRHAQAVPKGTVSDALRPLDEGGAAAAAALAALLATFAPRARVISSPAVRCIETVRPYAGLAGVPVETDPALSITKSADPPANLLGTLARSGRPAIVCLHRENLPAALATACAAVGAKPPDHPELQKGSFWVLHFLAGGCELVAAERYHPLAVSAAASGAAVSATCHGRAPSEVSAAVIASRSVGRGGSQASLRTMSGESRFSVGSVLASASSVTAWRAAASRIAASGSRSAHRCAGGGPFWPPPTASGSSSSARPRARRIAVSHSFSCLRAVRLAKPATRSSCGCEVPAEAGSRAASMIAASGSTRRGDRSASWAIWSRAVHSSRTTARPRLD